MAYSCNSTWSFHTRGALCIDGSVAGFHGRNGSKTSLLISLPGGGWCWDGPTCSNRAQTTLGSMTKYIEARGHTLHVGPVGEMSALPSGNPYFWNFTAVSPVYCDGPRGCVERVSKRYFLSHIKQTSCRMYVFLVPVCMGARKSGGLHFCLEKR